VTWIWAGTESGTGEAEGGAHDNARRRDEKEREFCPGDQRSERRRGTWHQRDGRARYKTMTLATDEFIRRFLVHILPHGFHRIRHYGLFANGNRAANIACARD
jgi:hypothetical protein